MDYIHDIKPVVNYRFELIEGPLIKGQFSQLAIGVDTSSFQPPVEVSLKIEPLSHCVCCTIIQLHSGYNMGVYRICKLGVRHFTV